VTSAEKQAIKRAEKRVLSRGERLKFHLLSNRMKYGALILAVSTVFRMTLQFEGHTEVADTLKAIADLVMGGGAALLAAGAAKSDDWHEEQKVEVVRSRSSDSIPIPRRRKTDMPGSTEELPLEAVLDRERERNYKHKHPRDPR
jgi:hypothetical protein